MKEKNKGRLQGVLLGIILTYLFIAIACEIRINGVQIKPSLDETLEKSGWVPKDTKPEDRDDRWREFDRKYDERQRQQRQHSK